VVDFYLKNSKDPGPDKFQAELIKTMSPEQIRVLQQWLNEVLTKGDLVTKVTEEEMEGKLALLHKGGPKVDQVAHWRPVVLLNITNQLIVYVINEHLTEMVEHAVILTQAQGGFHQNKSTDINDCKLYGLTKTAQRLKKRFVRVISGETRSPTARNLTNVISVKRCGNLKEDSPRREPFQSRH
jgi:hypothetical protein